MTHHRQDRQEPQDTAARVAGDPHNPLQLPASAPPEKKLTNIVDTAAMLIVVNKPSWYISFSLVYPFLL